MLKDAALAYVDALHAADSAAVASEPEAQLTVPLARLFEAAVAEAGLGKLRLLREAQLPGVRPDFAALVDGRPCGWLELKAPGHTVAGAEWTGREKSQWQRLSELDALVVCNGQQARLYRLGEPVADDSGQVAEAALPLWGHAEDWDPAPLIGLLERFTALRPPVVRRVSQLAHRLAPLTGHLRDRIRAGLLAPAADTPLKRARQAWARHVHDGVDDTTFASDLAQVVAYSMAIAALRGDADTDGDQLLTLEEARVSIRGRNQVLAAALSPVLEVPGLREELALEVAAIERLASVVDAQAIANSSDPRGEPWLWFYEDFLEAYDPEARRGAGVYYTPTPVVDAQVRLVDHILRDKLERPLGFGEKSVVTLDPAAGSGTYPLSVLDRAAAVAADRRGPAGPSQVAKTLGHNLIAFELLPGPYAVAQLRIGQRLAELAGTLLPPEEVRAYLTDTLDDPDVVEDPLDLWGDMDVLAQERARARKVKASDPVTVVLGNPPYERRTRRSGGGWVVHPLAGRSLFDDVIEPAQQAGVIFSAQASLYNDYVYFWRWALWKAFEKNDGPAVVSFITASSWLDGPAFTGLRTLARDLTDEMWIVDLGGEGRGAVLDENVFAIQTPVAIVTLHRTGAKTPTPARVLYRRIDGARADKLAAMATLDPPKGLDDQQWQHLDVDLGARLLPSTGDAAWADMPALTDLFPWQQPGCKFNRTWPIAPDPDTLRRRWDALLERIDSTSRAEAFVTSSSGRTIHTNVNGMPRLAELQPGVPPQPVVRYGYRSFDRQWTYEDPRLANLERPSLWGTRSNRQIYLSSMTTTELGVGPVLTVTSSVPDMHHFRGSYGGKDVLPIYRDSAATAPNVPAGLLEHLADHYGRSVIVEDLAAYVYALLAHPGYQQRFADGLATPGPRVPLTRDVELFTEAVGVGATLLWLHTYATRYRDTAQGRGAHVPTVPGLHWARAVTTLPQTTNDCTYDSDTGELHVGDGVVAGVNPAVWNYSLSGWAVVPKWLGHRTRKGIGRAAGGSKPLDRIRPSVWADDWNDELLDLLRVLTHTVRIHDEQSDLLERVVTAGTFTGAELPQAAAHERKAPAG